MKLGKEKKLIIEMGEYIEIFFCLFQILLCLLKQLFASLKKNFFLNSEFCATPKKTLTGGGQERHNKRIWSQLVVVSCLLLTISSSPHPIFLDPLRYLPRSRMEFLNIVIRPWSVRRIMPIDEII
jgi:hypothetical protein